jgi:hypothetical protein
MNQKMEYPEEFHVYWFSEIDSRTSSWIRRCSINVTLFYVAID